MHKINGYINDADIYQKDSIYKAEISDQEHRNIAANILSLHTNKKVADTKGNCMKNLFGNITII
jgi:hypothetical protein